MNTIVQAWVVHGTTGDYEARQEWLVRVFIVEQDARDFASVGNDWLKERSIHRHQRCPSHFGPKPDWDQNFFFSPTGVEYFVDGPVPLVLTTIPEAS